MAVTSSVLEMSRLENRILIWTVLGPDLSVNMSRYDRVAMGLTVWKWSDKHKQTLPLGTDSQTGPLDLHGQEWCLQNPDKHSAF